MGGVGNGRSAGGMAEWFGEDGLWGDWIGVYQNSSQPLRRVFRLLVKNSNLSCSD